MWKICGEGSILYTPPKSNLSLSFTRPYGYVIDRLLRRICLRSFFKAYKAEPLVPTWTAAISFCATEPVHEIRSP